MPPSREELRQRVVRGLRDRALKNAALADIVSSFQEMSLGQQNALVRAVAQGNEHQVGRIIIHAVHEALSKQATTRADEILADDRLTIEELGEFWD